MGEDVCVPAEQSHGTAESRFDGLVVFWFGVGLSDLGFYPGGVKGNDRKTVGTTPVSHQVERRDVVIQLSKPKL